jgi:hypothetical protein
MVHRFDTPPFSAFRPSSMVSNLHKVTLVLACQNAYGTLSMDPTFIDDFSYGKIEH